MAETPDNPNAQEAEQTTLYTPEQKQQIKAVYLVECMIRNVTEEAIQLKDKPEERALFLARRDDMEEELIQHLQTDNPYIVAAWEQEKQKRVPDFEQKKLGRDMTQEKELALFDKAKEREKFARVRDAVKDYLNEEGLQRFDEAIEKEMGYRG